MDIKILEQEIERLTKSVKELQVLNEIVTAISSTMTTQEINRLIVEKCILHFCVEQGYLSLFQSQPDNAEIPKTFVRAADHSDEYAPIRLGTTLTGWIVKYGEALMINNAQSDKRFSGVEFRGSSIRSVLVVPLQVKNILIGFLALFNKKNGDFTDDDKNLLMIIAMQSAHVIESARLYEQEKRLIFLQQELKAAQVIQKNLLPVAAPCIPGYEIDGVMIPAKEVGGDYYDFLHLDADHLGIALGDVCGKGLPAALVMANLQATLHSQMEICRDVSECMANINRLLCRRMELGNFVTFFWGMLNPGEKLLTFCNAGHIPPILIKSNGDIIRLSTGGMAIGLLPDTQYHIETIPIHSGDLLAIVSDGITEAPNPADEFFGEDKLISLLESRRNTSVKDIIDSIVRTLKSFQEGEKPEDDMSIVILKAE